jgi:hypothetical protein
MALGTIESALNCNGIVCVWVSLQYGMVWVSHQYHIRILSVSYRYCIGTKSVNDKIKIFGH